MPRKVKVTIKKLAPLKIDKMPRDPSKKPTKRVAKAPMKKRTTKKA